MPAPTSRQAQAAVNLDGSASADPGGAVTTYAWTQTAGTGVILSGATTATPSFTAPASNGTLTFSLTVTDNIGLTAADSVSVTITGGTNGGGGGESSALSTLTLLLMGLLPIASWAGRWRGALA